MSTLRSIEEYKAAAMLLGMAYDKIDHTMVEKRVDGNFDMYDPDTMSYLCASSRKDWPLVYMQRKRYVQDGKMGPGK